MTSTTTTPTTTADELSYSVEFGLRLAKRIYYGTNHSFLSPPTPQPPIYSKFQSYLPSAVTLYAVITEPSIVDNPDISSYQPYVYGRCDPPALIPLEMHRVTVQIECYLDTAFVTLDGLWRLHCVAASKRCDCRIAVPLGHQGSVLGVEVDAVKNSYYTQIVSSDIAENKEKLGKLDGLQFLKHELCTFKIPQVDGGSFIKATVRWSQKLLFDRGEFCLSVPFRFPSYVNPVTKIGDGREKIQLSVNCGPLLEASCKTFSHPLKELSHEVGKFSFMYDIEVKSWSNSDIDFSYRVSSTDISGGLILHPPHVDDYDQRDMFCLYMLPGNRERKVYGKKVIFLVDLSGSMRGNPLANAKNAIMEALSRLSEQDYFNVVAFNEDTILFSTELERATEEAIGNACQWINKSFIAEGGTDLMRPIKQALEMLTASSDLIPLIFLLTDGSVEDERLICTALSDHLANGKPADAPRIFALGIGIYCNHYFLKMLAQLGKGQYDASYDTDTIELRMRRLFDAASSIVLKNITIESMRNVEKLEIHPDRIPDLMMDIPVIVSGRYIGNFPDTVKVKASLADESCLTLDLKVLPAKDLPLDMVLARRQIDSLTADAWWSQNKKLEEQVAKISLRTGFLSEYTSMTLVQTVNEKQAPDVARSIKILGDWPTSTDLRCQKIILLGSLGIGFGDLTSTCNNVAHGIKLTKNPILVKAASNCCKAILDRCCCMCCIQTMSRMNDQCAIVFAQLSTALACFGCLSCCFDLCDQCS